MHVLFILFVSIVQTPSVTVSNDLVRINDHATLTCTVTISDNNPLLVNASVTWSPNGGSEGLVVRSSSSEYTFMANYTINSVEADDAQSYTCSAMINAISNNNILSSDQGNGIGTIYATGTHSHDTTHIHAMYIVCTHISSVRH